LSSKLMFVLARKQQRRSVGMEKRIGCEIQDSQCTYERNIEQKFFQLLFSWKSSVLHFVSVFL
jgi:hypothetical protein